MNFSLNINKPLSKDLILSSCTEEQIFAFYIGSDIRSKKLFRSKLRQDRNPTCSMYRSKSGNLIYKDFATGQHLNCFGYVMELFKCDYYEALRIIANDFNIQKNEGLTKNKGKIIPKDFKIDEKEFSKIQVEIQEFSDLELKWWEKYGITLDILKKFNVYSCKHVFLNDNLVAKSQQNCPIYGYYGRKYQGNELWRCYFPKRREYRFITNWPTKKIQGYDQLPKNGKLLVITKSMKDTMCLYSIGITAIAPNSETQFISDTVLTDLKSRFDHIVVLFDLDHTGIQFSKKIKYKYPDITVTLLPREDRCKDISDYYEMYGKNKTIQMIKRKIQLYKQNILKI
jgi:hypothetical protein